MTEAVQKRMRTGKPDTNRTNPEAVEEQIPKAIVALLLNHVLAYGAHLGRVKAAREAMNAACEEFECEVTDNMEVYQELEAAMRLAGFDRAALAVLKTHAAHRTEVRRVVVQMEINQLLRKQGESDPDIMSY